MELCGGDENVITNEFGIAKIAKVGVKKCRRPNEPNEKKSVQTQSTIPIKTNIHCLH
jgi:hypothetical protein